MEEPSTPSSQMWWQLMGDDTPMSPRASGRRTSSTTPKSLTSLWSSPSSVPEDTFHDEGKSTPREIYRNDKELTSQQSRKPRSNSNVDENKTTTNLGSVNSPENSSSYQPNPTTRITVTQNIPPSSVDGTLEFDDEPYRKKKQDRYDDSSYADEGAADKFLDLVEEGICTLDLNSPTLGEIEKRIEESWKEIEIKTAKFLRCRSPSRCLDTTNTTTHETNHSPEATSNLKIFSCGEEPEKSLTDAHDKDNEDGEAEGGELALQESQDSNEQNYDRNDDYEEAGNNNAYRSRDRLRSERLWDITEEDMENLIQENTFDLNSYTGTYLQRFKERNGVHFDQPAAMHSAPTVSGVESLEYDASTLTTTTTTTHDLGPHPSLDSRDPPERTMGPRSTTSTKKMTAPTKSPTNMSLVIYEPTNKSALLVQKRHQIQRQNEPGESVRTPADTGDCMPESFLKMPDENPDFRRRCLSPILTKKSSSLSFGMIGSSSTESTSHSGRTKSSESRGENETSRGNKYWNQNYVNSHHVYIAYFERGSKANKVMKLYEHPIPQAFPTLSQEIVVRIAYSTISHTDCAVRRGTYWGDDSTNPLNLPIISGVAFSGYVTQLNRTTMRSGIRYNDRVVSLVRSGANARHICISRDKVVIVPDELQDDKTIACLPEIYLGAFQVLHMGNKNGARYRRSSLSGKTILILGGATILGKALIQLCNAGGAHTIYATGKERHFSIIEEAGALPVNRDPKHWFSLLKGRIDLVVGLDNDNFPYSEASSKHLEVLSTKGRAVLFGAPETSCDAAIDGQKTIFVYNVFDSWESDLRQGKRDLLHLCKLLMDGSINPHVLETIPLSQVAHAQDTVENRDFSSFLLCDPWIQTKREQGKVVPPQIVYSGTTATRSSTKMSSRVSVITGVTKDTNQDNNSKPESLDFVPVRQGQVQRFSV